MSYTALYRKFRPTQFEDVKGQDHIVKTLKNQVKAERVGHAYLFCGTRGTGKTSVAKILARAVNCQNPVEGSPCNQCSICRAIAAQTSLNVIEIDAASNNGVDNIREIVEEVQYSPTEGKYKVYIIDEAHMLSAGAFNALLKTLEEPPSYVIFILATTEAHKIPITILSRCQRYDFKRITNDVIANRLKELIEKEDLKAEEKAVRYVAKAADGSMRDALSLLDQCIAFYFGEELTYDRVLEVLGAVDVEVFSALYQYIQEQNVTAVIELLDEMITNGRELSQFVTDFIWYLRNLLLIKTSDSSSELVDVSSEQLTDLKEKAEDVSMTCLMRYIQVFSELSNQIKYASQKRALTEIAFIKLLKPEMDQSQEGILERLRIVEKKLEQGMYLGNAEAVSSRPLEEASKEIYQKEKKSEVLLEKALPEEIKEAKENWPAIKNKLPVSIKSFLQEVEPMVGEDHTFILMFEDPTARAFVNKEEHLEEIKSAIKDSINKEVSVRTKLTERNKNKKTEFDLAAKFNMPIQKEES